ncbi:hypothetical protein CDAR_312431 [Caerostris darwini]|uniref:Uncharacterized protein n=1 Tax=Caerostris darwini TaxID=1538125 RepID=A0AAV4QTY8_9ARAC|nr:hypothetical protein CDAR_312431 [Caerostris darwini]
MSAGIGWSSTQYKPPSDHPLSGPPNGLHTNELTHQGGILFVHHRRWRHPTTIASTQATFACEHFTTWSEMGDMSTHPGCPVKFAMMKQI